jgi:alpha-amylase/alpha-mannosidase (GH57 family)
MHQPDYRDKHGIMQMPWVFLHGIKDYYDMPWMLSRFEGVKATFNLTPTLIIQLKLYYENAHEKDKFLSLWARDVKELLEEDRKWIIKICKSAQYDTMIQGISRFEELYYKDHFNNQDLIDLEVLFILSWCGVYLKTHNELVRSLLAKQRNFEEYEKAKLLEELSKFIASIFDFYKELQAQGRISLSTTPLNHPILPLLIDMQNGVRANPHTNIPQPHYSLKEDAKLQIERARGVFEETFGFLPEGFWPAEGAVDPQSVNLLRECGVKWIATDEEILFKSLHSKHRDALYHSYIYDGVCIGFRDKALSDLIGFQYRNQEGEHAANHFIQELEKIQRSDEQRDVFVILDGENAWEFFKNNGLDFFDALYAKIQKTPWCNTRTMDEVYQQEHKKLEELGVGSWIHGALNTWVGHTEKTKAWELVYMAKTDYEHHKEKLSLETQESITVHFLAAECSDWYWWYGDDHFSEFGAEFDTLFRSHLIDIYDLMQITPPSDMFLPIIQDVSTQHFHIKPQSDISPDINGHHDSFFEWIGCGVIDESKLFSTMDRDRGLIQKMLYGNDANKLYFSFQVDSNIHFTADAICIIIDALEIKGNIELKDQISTLNGYEINVFKSSWTEMSIDIASVSLPEISIRFELLHEGKVVQTLPGFGELKIDLSRDYSHNWFV